MVSLDSPEGKVLLEEILFYHVFSGDMPSTDIDECIINETVNGQPLAFSLENGVMVNDANVTLADVVASNGIIHVIDKVLTPTDTPNNIARTAQCTGIHDSLVAGIVQAELLETLQGPGPFTVFAPTDTFYDAGTSLEPNGNPGDLRLNTDYNLFEGFSQANQYFGGVFSEDAQTNVQALNDEVEFRVAGTKVGSVAYDGVNITTALKTTNITISDNIVTSENNTALQLVPNGAGKVKFFNNTAFDDNKIQNLANDNSLTIASTDDGYIKINTTVNGFVIPVGDDTNRGATPVVGELRYNTEAGDEGGAEVYNGTEWVSVAGDNSQADALVIGEAIDEWTLILG